MSDAPEAAEPALPNPQATHVVAEWKHDSPQVSCRIDPGGRFVFAGAMNNTVLRYRIDDGQLTVLSGVHDSWVMTLGFDPATDSLFTGGYDGRIVRWPVAADAPTPQSMIDAHAGWVRSIAASPERRWLASCGNDRLVKLWSLDDGSLLGEMAGHESYVYRVCFHPDGSSLFSGDIKGRVKQWNLESFSQMREFDASALYRYEPGQQVDFGGVRSLAVRGDGKLLAVGGTTDATNPLGAVHTPLVLLFDPETGEQVQAQRPQESFNGSVWALHFHPAGFLMAGCGGGGGGHVLFFKPEEAGEFHKASLANFLRDLDVHPDGLRLATAHADSVVRVYSMAPQPESNESDDS